jgi:hypothetical protein
MADQTVNLVLQGAVGATIVAPTTHVFAVADPPAPPTITNVVPAFGPEFLGTAVTITGTAFQTSGVDNVHFGGVSVTGFLVVNNTTITCTVPGLPAAFVNVQLRKLGANIGAPLVNGFEYQGAPA